MHEPPLSSWEVIHAAALKTDTGSDAFAGLQMLSRQHLTRVNICDEIPDDFDYGSMPYQFWSHIINYSIKSRRDVFLSIPTEYVEEHLKQYGIGYLDGRIIDDVDVTWRLIPDHISQRDDCFHGLTGPEMVELVLDKVWAELVAKINVLKRTGWSGKFSNAEILASRRIPDDFDYNSLPYWFWEAYATATVAQKTPILTKVSTEVIKEYLVFLSGDVPSRNRDHLLEKISQRNDLYGAPVEWLRALIGVDSV